MNSQTVPVSYAANMLKLVPHLILAQLNRRHPPRRKMTLHLPVNLHPAQRHVPDSRSGSSSRYSLPCAEIRIDAPVRLADVDQSDRNGASRVLVPQQTPPAPQGIASTSSGEGIPGSNTVPPMPVTVRCRKMLRYEESARLSSAILSMFAGILRPYHESVRVLRRSPSRRSSSMNLSGYAPTRSTPS